MRPSWHLAPWGAHGSSTKYTLGSGVRFLSNWIEFRDPIKAFLEVACLFPGCLFHGFLSGRVGLEIQALASDVMHKISCPQNLQKTRISMFYFLLVSSGLLLMAFGAMEAA